MVSSSPSSSASSSRIDDAFSVSLNSFTSASASANTASAEAFNLPDNSSFLSATSFQTANPFNDSTSSGFGTSFDGSVTNQLHDTMLPDLKAFTTNVDKLDGILSHLNGINTITASGSHMEMMSSNQTGNPFVGSPEKNELKGVDLSTSLPLTGKKKSMDKNKINYDALRETIDSDVLNVTCPMPETITNPNKIADKPQMSMDFFKDAAAAAFSEFGNSRVNKHEFYNKISDVDFTRNGVTGLR